jgi:hypothetical protein
MKHTLLLTALFLVCLVAAGFQIRSVQKWEYKVEYNASENKLNQLGAEGWELVGASPEASTSNITGFYFKRQKP